MALTAILTDKGPAYIDLGRIETISSPFKNKYTGLMVRALGMFGGSKIYIYDNNENRERLKDVLPLDAAELAAPFGPATDEAPKPKRKRKAAGGWKRSPE